MDRDRRGLYYYYDRKVTTSEGEGVDIDIGRQQGGDGGDTFEYSNLNSAGYISSHSSAAVITPHDYSSAAAAAVIVRAKLEVRERVRRVNHHYPEASSATVTAVLYPQNHYHHPYPHTPVWTYVHTQNTRSSSTEVRMLHWRTDWHMLRVLSTLDPIGDDWTALQSNPAASSVCGKAVGGGRLIVWNSVLMLLLVRVVLSLSSSLISVKFLLQHLWITTHTIVIELTWPS